MFNKIYVKTKEIIKENYIFISLCLVMIATLLYPLPYYIYNGGGTINVDKRVNITNSYDSKGSFNLCYVTEIKATISSYLLAKILPGWDITPKEEITLNSNETDKDVYTRDRIFLTDANVNAIHVAYSKANKDFIITDTNNYVIYIAQEANTDLKIGDMIKKVDGVDISSLEDIKKIVNNKNTGDEIEIEVIRNQKEKKCKAKVFELENNKYIGITTETTYDYDTNPKIKLKFSKNEAGPSGGLLLTLSIYNHLTTEDITNGMKIAGTGTIDWEGNVGSIGGVKYKLKGAVRDKADVFIVPNGENYEEAIKVKNKYKYNIKIIGISTFDEALKKLKEMSK